MVVDGAVYKRTSTPPLVKQMRPLRGVFCFYPPIYSLSFFDTFSQADGIRSKPFCMHMVASRVSPSKSSAIELHPQLAQMVPPEDLYWGCHRKTYPLIFGITGLGCVRRWPISAPASQPMSSVMGYEFQGQDQLHYRYFQIGLSRVMLR